MKNSAALFFAHHSERERVECAKGWFIMCLCRDKTGRVLLGIGIGLILSLLFSGWFLRILLGGVLIVAGCLLLNDD